MSILVTIGLFLVAFLLGSVPWGLIISRLFFHTDIRQHGSGNIGTTNAMRVMGKKGGAAVFILDFGKGLLSGALALSAYQLALSMDPQAAQAALTAVNGSGASFADGFYDMLKAVAFLGCTWGHIFSPWLGFKGGKGIAVAVGCLFVTYGVVGAVIELLLFAILVLLTRYVSVGSVAAAALCPFLGSYYFWGNWPAVIMCAIAGLTVIWAHRGNIKRLIDGNERRIGDKKKA